ncbi:LysE family transporter [Candidatus Pelagibacter sp.]|nr:LysE family transporter [Candidatus Pelagibacter sp.]
MNFLLLGFFTGLSLILAIGAQNIFVIEQGLKKNFIFIVCLICAISDFLLIFLGIFLFHYFDDFFNESVELILNILLLLFLLHFIWGKINIKKNRLKLNQVTKNSSLLNTIYKTIGFTYLNPHVYSDTVFFLGNFSKNFLIKQKYLFGIGASLSSIIFFFILGYLSKYLSKYLKNDKIWKIINLIIVFFMSFLALYVVTNILK